MINVTRENAAPSSLETPEIRKYIDDLQAHLDDPENIAKPNVTENYRNSDLLEAFDRCFYQKCYLTEQKFPNSHCLDVEHFVSKSVSPQLRYTWTNLFPADHKANKMKPRIVPDGGYLNPSLPEDDVETQIMYSVGPLGQEPSFKPADPNNLKAANTSKLLDRLHNGHDQNTALTTAGLRHEIYKKYHHILLLLLRWKDAPDHSNLKHQYGIELKLHLSRKSSFTMLMRSMIPVTLYVPSEYLD